MKTINNNYIERQDRIDSYVLDRMTDDERQQFEQDMAHDSDLKAQTVFTENVRRAIVCRNEKLAKMREWDREGKSKAVYWLSSVAAVLVFGFFQVQFWFNKLDEGELLTDNNRLEQTQHSEWGNRAP